MADAATHAFRAAVSAGRTGPFSFPGVTPGMRIRGLVTLHGSSPNPLLAKAPSSARRICEHTIVWTPLRISAR